MTNISSRKCAKIISKARSLFTLDSGRPFRQTSPMHIHSKRWRAAECSSEWIAIVLDLNHIDKSFRTRFSPWAQIRGNHTFVRYQDASGLNLKNWADKDAGSYSDSPFLLPRAVAICYKYHGTSRMTFRSHGWVRRVTHYIKLCVPKLISRTPVSKLAHLVTRSSLARRATLEPTPTK